LLALCVLSLLVVISSYNGWKDFSRSELHQEEGCLGAHPSGACVINAAFEQLPDLLCGQTCRVNQLQSFPVCVSLLVFAVDQKNKLFRTLFFSKATQVHQSTLSKELIVSGTQRGEETPCVLVQDTGEVCEDVGAQQAALRGDHKSLVVDVERLGCKSGGVFNEAEHLEQRHALFYRFLMELRIRGILRVI